ncbi:MAG: LytR/AlgR family response regulator transcription factor [Bacillota bacterium]
MNYRFALCDDEPADLKYIATLVAQWADASGHTAAVEPFPSAEAFLLRYAEDKAYDILLLDIEMGQMNGVALARAIRAENKEVQIVFITGYMDYIANGYDVEALHYLMKPVNEAKLLDVLKRAADKLRRNERALLLEIHDETVRIPLYEIQYLEVRQNYVTIHAREEHTVKRPLSEIEKELDESFFRVGRSFIVNLRYIRKITKTDVYLKNGAVVPLSRGMYEPLNRAMISYF